jgi:hypothetical protein
MTEFVSVPVPIDRVQEVYELLARQSPERLPDRRATGGSHSGVWSQTLIDRMFQESSETMRRILTAIADAAPGWVTTKDIAVVSGLSARQVAAALGPFEKRVRGRYRMSYWPFEAREFVDSGISKYSMSKETADRIGVLAAELVQHDLQHEQGQLVGKG